MWKQCTSFMSLKEEGFYFCFLIMHLFWCYINSFSTQEVKREQKKQVYTLVELWHSFLIVSENTLHSWNDSSRIYWVSLRNSIDLDSIVFIMFDVKKNKRCVSEETALSHSMILCPLMSEGTEQSRHLEGRRKGEKCGREGLLLQTTCFTRSKWLYCKKITSLHCLVKLDLVSECICVKTWEGRSVF